MIAISNVDAWRSGLAITAEIIRCEGINDGLLNSVDEFTRQYFFCLSAQIEK